MPAVRICPNDDGTFHGSIWDYKREDWIHVAPRFVMEELAKVGTVVEVAVNDPNDDNSTFECHGETYRI